MKHDEFWNAFLDNLNNKLNPISFNSWFKDSKLVSYDNNNIVISVSSKYIKDYIKDYYEDLLEEVSETVTGNTCTIEVITPDEIKIEKEEVIIEEAPVLPRYKENNSNLNPQYTFANFVVGDSNRFPQTVALQVAERPGQLYNPLFIYGKSGLGKTHLMHAIGNFIQETSNKSVLYITSETFISDFTQINRKDEDKYDLVAHFKDKYRNIDVLIIDDIQFLSGASKTQDEFFNTFNFLHDTNKQIIISSDRSPDDLKVLEERLTTRFTW